jgi:hypothetical protein
VHLGHRMSPSSPSNGPTPKPEDADEEDDEEDEDTDVDASCCWWVLSLATPTESTRK